MHKLFYGLISLWALHLNIITASAAASAPTLSEELPAVAQDTDVHALSKTYCRALWARLNRPDILGYDRIASPIFRDKFAEAVSQVGIVLGRISKKEPIMIGDEIILHTDPIADLELLPFASYFDDSSLSKLILALNSMKELGKHKGGSDLDNETIAHVNEIFVYVWNKVKEDPSSRLPTFLMGLQDAAPTCIQGYSVRMLCAVHPPKHKTITPVEATSATRTSVRAETVITAAALSATPGRR